MPVMKFMRKIVCNYL